MDATEFEIDRPDGTVAHSEVAWTRVDLNGRPFRLGVFRDVTEQRQMRAQLLVADRMVAVGTLAAGVAHEINNPLSAIMTNVELAIDILNDHSTHRRDEATRTELLEMLGDARSAAERVRTIARDVKIFSRAEEERVGPVKLRRVIESSVRMAWNEVRHRARVVQIDGDVPPVVANEARLGQVFLNLIMNAAQAIPEGDAAGNEIRIQTCVHEQGWVIIEVSDTGVGMPREVQKRLFQPFFTTKAAGVGTGLGLSICHRIITSFGGTITVSSLVGHGTTFRIALPRSDGDATATPTPTVTVAPASHRGRLLLVDDEPMIAAVVRRALSADHNVEVSEDGADALARLMMGQRFDVILCDLMMPQMSGMELFERIGALAPEHVSRLIFLTGGAFSAQARGFLETVKNPVLEKPFDTIHLRALVNARVEQG